jgi:hypothetical protein
MSGPAELPSWQADRLTTLLSTLGAIPLSDAERASLTWLCGFEAHTVENIAAVIWRAQGRACLLAEKRAAKKKAEQRRQLINVRLAADFYRLRFINLCEQAGIDPGEDPHAALLAHLRSELPDNEEH